MLLPRCLGRWLGAFVVLGSVGCQAILGDFAVEPQSTEPESGLGTACEPSELRCEGPTLEVCAPDRRGFTAIMACETAGQCDASAGACRSCFPGEAACNGGVRQVCNVSRKLEDVMDCKSAALCQLAGDRSSASCLGVLCKVGEFSCDGNRLLECAPGLDHWDLVARCASAPLCDEARAADQRKRGVPPTCVTPTCLPGSFACDGAALSRCSADQNAWEPLLGCPDAASCNPSSGSCTPADDGTLACSGSDLVEKGADGFERVASCKSPLLCDPVAGACVTSSCGEAGSLRCSDDVLPALEECSGDGQWFTREVCDHRSLCDAKTGRCFPKACDNGDVRCVGRSHQICSADRSHWETDQICEDGDVCNVGGCEPDGCTQGTLRCVADRLELCNGGFWEPKLRCATPELCSAATSSCTPPECGGAAGEYSCSPDGKTLRRCDPTRTMWNAFRQCTGSTPVCNSDRPVAGGIPVCNACQPLTYACSGLELTRCAADGLSSPTIANCPMSCSVTSGVPACD